MAAHADTHAHEEEHHHHKETFVTKYIFSQDHKMIAKQYLVTGTIMGVIGVIMSLMFRMQIAWPEQPNVIFEALLGKWAPEGVMDAGHLFSISYHTWYHHGILCTYCWFEWYV